MTFVVQEVDAAQAVLLGEPRDVGGIGGTREERVDEASVVEQALGDQLFHQRVASDRVPASDLDGLREGEGGLLHLSAQLRLGAVGRPAGVDADNRDQQRERGEEVARGEGHGGSAANGRPPRAPGAGIEDRLDVIPPRRTHRTAARLPTD